MRVTVIGHGSIGQRHARNIRSLGVDVLTVDPNGSADLTDIWALPPVDAAVIATPASEHAITAMRLAVMTRGPLFVEKPVGVSLEGPRDRPGLEYMLGYSKAGGGVQAGYNLRFVPAIQQFRDRIAREAGEIFWARLEFGQDLLSWRPGRDYRSTPATDGILLEASHEIDLMLWLLGPVNRVLGAVVRATTYEVRDDLVQALIEMESGALVELHLDMTSPGYTRRITVGGSKDTMWCEPLGRVIADKDTVDAMYVAEMAAFLKSVETGVLDPHAATVEDAIAVHKVIELIRAKASSDLPPEVEGLWLDRHMWPARH